MSLRYSIFAFFLIASLTDSVRAEQISSPGFISKVMRVDRYGTVHFENEKSLRLWGLVAAKEPLGTLLTNVELECKSPVEVSHSMRVTNVAICEYRDRPLIKNEIFGLLLAETLLQSNAANEFCSESLNYFRTCK